MVAKIVPSRTCGGCTACCTTHEVVEIAKPAGQTCGHCSGSGCNIYAKRPRGCRRWSCQWLIGFGEDADRPDLSGVVIDFQPLIGLESVGLFFEFKLGALELPQTLEQTRKILLGNKKVLHWFLSQKKVLYLSPRCRLTRTVRRAVQSAKIEIREFAD